MENETLQKFIYILRYWMSADNDACEKATCSAAFNFYQGCVEMGEKILELAGDSARIERVYNNLQSLYR